LSDEPGLQPITKRRYAIRTTNPGINCDKWPISGRHRKNCGNVEKAPISITIRNALSEKKTVIPLRERPFRKKATVINRVIEKNAKTGA
jgi:hypothetical protein